MLSTFLNENQRDNITEVYNIITNLKYILAKEITNKQRNQDKLVVKNDYSSLFYNNISHRYNFVIKFFYERFNIFSTIFFSREYLIENLDIHNNDKDEKLFTDYIRSNTSNILPFPRNASKILSEDDKVDYKVKIEVSSV